MSMGDARIDAARLSATELAMLDDMLERAIRDTGRQPQPGSTYDYLGRLIAEVRASASECEKLRALVGSLRAEVESLSVTVAALEDPERASVLLADSLDAADFVEVERPVESASECEKLKAALRALVEADTKFFGNEPEGDYDALDAARALVGSVPPNEADE